MKNRINPRLTIPGLIVLALLFSGPAPGAAARDKGVKTDLELGAMMVTAQKSRENVQEIPIPVTVFSDMVLEDADMEDVDDVVDHIPNMTFNSSYAQGYNRITFRGMGLSPFTGKNPVVIFIDGIGQDNYADYGVDLLNIQRVEVLRGAQGTLYGKNAIGGVINIVSKPPGNDSESRLRLEAAQDHTFRVKGILNGPIVKDKLFYGISGSFFETDGYMENDYPGQDNFNHDESFNLNTRFRWLPRDRMEVNFHTGLSSTESGSGSGINAMAGQVKYHEYRNPGDKTDYDSFRTALNIGINGDRAGFTAITTYSYYEEHEKNDNAYMGAFQPDGTATYDYQNFSQEFRLQSPEDHTGLKWLGGLYFSGEQTHWDDMGYTYDTRSMLGYKTYYNWPDSTREFAAAAFGQVTLPLPAGFNLTGGLRYEHSEKEMDYRYEVTRPDTGEILPSDPFNPWGPSHVSYFIEDEWNVLLPKAALAWRKSSDLTLYASVAKGYLAGGFNLCENIRERATFNEQTSIDYELGIKSTWLDHRLMVNANLFYMDIEDMHVYYAPNGYTYITSNAGKAHSKGIEIETRARPLPGLDITAALGLARAEFDDHTNTGGVDCSGKDLPDSPDYTLALSAQYRFESGWFCRGDMKGYGRYFFDDANTVGQKSFQIYNAKIGYEADRWDVYLYGKNLTDEAYFSFGTVQATGIKANVGEPRTFGIMATFRF